MLKSNNVLADEKIRRCQIISNNTIVGFSSSTFDNQTKKAQGMGGEYQALANNAQQQGQNLGNMFSNVGGGLSGAATAQANQNYWTDYFNKQKTKGG
jgi:hypothetical protein